MQTFNNRLFLGVFSHSIELNDCWLDFIKSSQFLTTDQKGHKKQSDEWLKGISRNCHQKRLKVCFVQKAKKS